MPTWRKAPEYQQRVKADVVAHYGGKCSCCGEGRLIFLTIDHVDGGGTKHRKVVGHGTQFYRWLVRNGYPAGFRVLCHNCNFAVGLVGVCPHVIESQ